MATPTVPCAICDKHRGVGELVGPILWTDDHAVVSHRPPALGTGLAIAGYLFVESREHVARWQDLSRTQASAVARASWGAARVLADHFGTDQVFSAIVGLRVPHFHQHVFVRHPGTPPTVPWYDPGSWDECPHLRVEELGRLAASLRARFDSMA
ncbi:HIT family protein [Cellulomonas sp. Y8]|uniref:HIT family protein n=1 Tax=Cellulomonas sp. Y8 TaxID=2591145 RepID=UPI0011C943FF|nr:histidine triad (HIT) protein [Cellulomonas sp. Y8]